MHVETYFPEDMYQGFLVGTPGGDGGVGENENWDYQQQRQPRPQGEEVGESAVQFDVNNETATTAIPTKMTVEQEPLILDVREHLRNRQQLIRKTYLSSDDHPYYGYPPLGFQRYILPFKHFVLTSRGRMRQAQRLLDGAVKIESIGFTLMDGKDGDFVFDLVSLRAVNLVNGEVVGSLEDVAREEEFRESLRSSPSPLLSDSARNSSEEGTDELIGDMKADTR